MRVEVSSSIEALTTALERGVLVITVEQLEAMRMKEFDKSFYKPKSNDPFALSRSTGKIDGHNALIDTLKEMAVRR